MNMANKGHVTLKTPEKTNIVQSLLLRAFVLMGLVITLVSSLPVLLLPLMTSVPKWLALALILLEAALVSALFFVERTPHVIVAIILGIVSLSAIAIWLSQKFASTPLTNAPNGIATLERIQLNGATQWITIRGADTKNPVLLYLAGGPGSSDLAWTRRYLSGLEDHFVVINWDQPGSAKSFWARDIKQLTMEQYLEDAYALILQLRERFHQQKIYLVGHSWGSLLGIQLAHSHPHLFHAYIGIGQMVNTTENDVMGYTFALDQLSQKSDTRTLGMLKKQGPPPYYGKDLLQKYARYSIVLARYMKAKAPGHPGMTLDAYRSGEYGWIDKMNLPRGGISTFSHVYPQLAPVDLKTIARQFDIPITFIHGRWDVNQMGSLTAEYYADIQAAHKEMIWFEQSGHLPHYEEPERFIDVMINQVLRETSE